MFFEDDYVDLLSKKDTLPNFGSLEGKMLVASPCMTDPYFERSVVYICSHGEDGAVGVVINQRICALPTEELFKQYSKGAKGAKNNLEKDGVKRTYVGSAKSLPLIFGGPVNQDIVIALSLTKKQEEIFDKHKKLNIHTNVGKLMRDIALKKVPPGKVLLVRGISTWEPYQLEFEIAENYWFIKDASAKLIFSQKKNISKWHDLMKELGVEVCKNFVSYSGNA